tara:strand:- start:80 stop:1114 length:1035 start_codon:yes stop_codon:yes gene_type:complete
MITKWLARESRWVDSEVLIEASKRIAVYLYKNQVGGNSDRLQLQEIDKFANQSSSDNVLDWDSLQSRSLLNRDSGGNFKFAHRSIMEYLFVLSAIDGVGDCFSLPWTDFMRELFVSWGHSKSGRDATSIERAKSILQSDLKATHLVPLSEPPPSPSQIVVNDLIKIAAGKLSAKSRNRPVSINWRSTSIKLWSESSHWKVFDLESSLTWRLPRFDLPREAGIEAADFYTLATILQMESQLGAWRSPSYAEFVHLLRGLNNINKIDIIHKSALYYIGDKQDERMHLLVSMSNKNFNSNLMNYLDRDRSIAGTSETLSTFTTGLYISASSYQEVKGIFPQVRQEAL